MRVWQDAIELERKRDSGSWTETLIINESNTIYGGETEGVE
jgi:hypothetical protein